MQDIGRATLRPAFLPADSPALCYFFLVAIYIAFFYIASQVSNFLVNMLPPLVYLVPIYRPLANKVLPWEAFNLLQLVTK
ncbi:MAG: hypothetical protein D3924_16350 [Candidatus Electrothrix sp. AR4]|nr:hypothetical protein [Candidatus Electrothrix sp. AR4]